MLSESGYSEESFSMKNTSLKIKKAFETLHSMYKYTIEFTPEALKEFFIFRILFLKKIKRKIFIWNKNN